MTLLEKLKSILGLDGASSSEEDRDVGVTVERNGSSSGTGETAGPTETTTATAGDASAETESPVSDTSAGTGETATSETEAIDAGEEDEPSGKSDATGEPETDEAESRVPSEAVDVIKGIGPTYADRLANAGIETVADLAGADADEVAGNADVPKGRLEDWIERAKARDR